MILLSAILVCAGISNAQDPRPAAEPDGNALVKLQLLGERAKLHPGEHFTLAAKLIVEPRWHIYWGENAGDTGVPTRLSIEAPKGFVIGAPRFPVPERHVDPGPLVSFVHEGVVLVLFDAVAPAKLEAGSKARFELDAGWLVCTTRCFEGEGGAALEIECATAGEPVPANEALFRDARAKQPRPLAELKELATEFERDAAQPNECRFGISVPGAQELEFIPAEQRDPAFVEASPAEGAKAPGLSLLYRWKDRPQGNKKVRCPGILRVKTKDGTASYWFDHEYLAGYDN